MKSNVTTPVSGSGVAVILGPLPVAASVTEPI